MFNELYQLLAGNLIYGGVAVALLFFIFFQDARKVALSNDKGKMFNWMVMPTVLIVGAAILAGVAWQISATRLQEVITSTPVNNAVALGDSLTKGIDKILEKGGVDVSGITSAFTSGGGVSVPSGGTFSSGGTLTLPGGGAVQQSPSTGNPIVLPTVVPTPAVEIEIVPMREQNAAAPSNGANGGAVTYVVQPGDSMYKIAEKMFGDGSKYADLCAANGMSTWQCGQLRKGQVIKLTFDGTSAPRERVPIAKPAPSGQQIYARQQQQYNPAVSSKAVVPVATTRPTTSYTIKAGDNIYKIAQQVGGMSKVYDICRMNRQTLGDNCDQLTAGATITLP